MYVLVDVEYLMSCFPIPFADRLTTRAILRVDDGEQHEEIHDAADEEGREKGQGWVLSSRQI
jgi:hypothetical protein